MHLYVSRRTSSYTGRWAARLARWPELSQQRACHNAMVASTALAAARRERDEVDAYVAGALARGRSSAETADSARAVRG